jgi:hypothetical protein
MKIIKGIFFAAIFVFQIILALIVYGYSAYNYSLTTTVFIAVIETCIALWAYGRMFKNKKEVKPPVKELPRHGGAIVKSIVTRKTIEI